MIDDEPKFVNIVSRALTARGFEVDGASDGTNGLAMALSRRYELVLLDLMLPGLSGIQVLRRIMKARPEQRVLVCSALIDPEQRARCLELGAIGYLTKPFDLSELVARLNHNEKEHSMRRAGAKPLLVAGIVAVALAVAGPASAADWRGTVVGKERARHALVIADSNGIVRTVRVGSAYRLRPTARVAINGNRLRDGTFQATGVRPMGRTTRARVHGIILGSRPGSYLIAAGKSVLAIRYSAERRLSSSTGAPRRGDQVVVRLSISRSGALSQQSLQVVAHGARLEVVGVLTALTNATHDGRLRHSHG